MAVELDALCDRCLDRTANVGDLLREARILAARNELHDLEEWIDVISELVRAIAGGLS